MKKCPYCAEKIQDEAIVCRYCGRDLPRQVKPKSPPKKQKIISKEEQKRNSRCMIWFFVIIALSICAMLCGGLLLQRIIPEPIKTQDSTKTSSTQERGDTRVLYVPGASNVFVAVDKSSFDAYGKAIARNDEYGINELIMQGRLFFVPNGTEVRVLDSTFITRKVRILEGEWEGASGWVPVEWVRK